MANYLSLIKLNDTLSGVPGSMLISERFRQQPHFIIIVDQDVWDIWAKLTGSLSMYRCNASFVSRFYANQNMAEPGRYVIVKFKKFPFAGMHPLQCVPASWIKCQMDDENVAVAFPPQLNSHYRSLMKTGKDPVLKWKQFPATIEGRRDAYVELNKEAAGAAGGTPGGPLSPPSLANLNISEPSTPTTSTPKKRATRITSAAVETQTASNQTVEVEQQLLEELYQKWEEMNIIMEKLFPTNYGNNTN